MIVFTILLLCTVITKQILAEEDGPVVKLPEGQVRGHFLKSLNGKTYYAFQDIPYAAPPVGDLRYKEPESPKPWDSILNATRNIKQCPQEKEKHKRSPIGNRYKEMTEDEDCLVISVYSPQKPGSIDLLPVLFWIHGGGFSVGNDAINLYNPAKFMDQDILVVSFNYRLGALGFLTTGDGVIPGNLGLKDQVFALKWVNTHIKLFGGDPNKVTIMGESSGAHSVSYIVVSNVAKGLFRGAIQDSGTSIGQMAFAANPRKNAFSLGRILDSNFTSENSEDLLQLLKKTSADDLVRAAAEVVPFDPNTAGYCTRFRFIPVLESKNASNALVTNAMYQSFIDGKFHTVPMLMGYNSQEAVLFLNDHFDYLAGAYDKDPSLMVEKTWNVPPEEASALGSELKQIYTKSFADDKVAFVKYSTDAGYSTGVIRQAQLASKYVPVYLYEFSYEGPMGLYINHKRGAVPGTKGASHGEELVYLWLIGPAVDSNDKLTSQRAVKMWTNFVKYQNPTPHTDKLLNNIIWPSVQPDNIQYLDINNELEVKTNPRYYKNVSSVLLRYIKQPHLVF